MDYKIENWPNDPRAAIKFIVNLLLNQIYPLLKRISDQMHNDLKDKIPDESFLQMRNVFTLCADQIRKCILAVFDTIKTEHRYDFRLQESRQCAIDRLSCCLEKLSRIEHLLGSNLMNILETSHDFTTPTMYFVNWIDQTFDILSKLSNIILRKLKTADDFSIEWKQELVDCVYSLHTSIDELLLSTMTLSKHCLPMDQFIVKARCQVVLRETKTLLSELIEGDSDKFLATTESLKMPIKPFNINVRIDILKDVLYVLETNTNTALLALVIHCFSQDIPQVEMLRGHFQNSSNKCACEDTYVLNDDVSEKCLFVKEFDLYNERLLQIGSFAMSCSSDDKRILNLRSGLASLEGLDPYLVPAVMVSPQSLHTSLLTRNWIQEMLQIRDSVFLIVDPAAFADKAKQMMNENLLQMTKDNRYDVDKTCTVINIGCVVYDFFDVYNKLEPDALTNTEELAPLLKDLDKAQLECKIVNNLLNSSNENKYNVKVPNETNVTFAKLLKRLKLLYTLVKRINMIYNVTSNDDEFFEEAYPKNVTYVTSPKKMANFSKSVFARTNLRLTGKLPLTMLTKNMGMRKNLSFSMKLEEICDMSNPRLNREPSILYYSPLKTKSSLRKVVLCKQLQKIDLKNDNFETESVMDDALSLQITEVLNQINDITINMSCASKYRELDSNMLREKSFNGDVLKLSLNNHRILRNVGDDTVNTSVFGNETVSNVSQPSEVNTLERINDLDLVESKLSDLKSMHIETSL